MHPLIRILRPALAPTAAADVLAAAAICGGAPLERLLLGAGASLCLYMGGMAQNDLADLERDKALHPDRPLPSQPSLVPKARVLVFVLFAAGLGLGGAAGAFWPAVVVATFASAYNLGLKQIFPADVLSMGGARGANLAFGFFVAAGAVPGYGWLYVAGYGFYIAAVSWASRAEDMDPPPTRRLALLLAYLVQLASCVVLAFLAANVASALWLALPAALLLAALVPAMKAGDRPGAKRYVLRSLLAIFCLHAAVALAAGQATQLLGICVAAAATFLILAGISK